MVVGGVTDTYTGSNTTIYHNDLARIDGTVWVTDQHGPSKCSGGKSAARGYLFGDTIYYLGGDIFTPLGPSHYARRTDGDGDTDDKETAAVLTRNTTGSVQTMASMADIQVWNTTSTSWSNFTVGGDSIIVHGGLAGNDSASTLNDTAILDLVSCTWSQPNVSRTVVPTSGHSAIMHGDQMLVMFGSDDDANPTSSFQILNTTSWQW
ncbi:hypothetical protein BZG36_05589 [Bifiguratus adelaidae]|uniref:Uncharacterized protein n=1 Tax=Bifiguratus adelaidae TaxID=1938954 RepID=A0A261XT04_9FUNG|nr:hypothetical protein BZG36_05589 [Bifiguratus adelaidae]